METDKIFNESAIKMITQNAEKFSSVYFNNSDMIVRLCKMTFESFDRTNSFFFSSLNDIFVNTVGQVMSVLDPESVASKNPEVLEGSISTVADMVVKELSPSLVSSSLIPLGALAVVGIYRLSRTEPTELKNVVVNILTEASKVAASINERANKVRSEYEAAELAAAEAAAKYAAAKYANALAASKAAVPTEPTTSTESDV